VNGAADPCWTAPHLVPSKDANPRVIWLKGSGWGGEISTITLTVKAAGDPTNRSTPADIVMVLDNSGSMSGTPIADLVTAAKTFTDFTGGTDRIAIYCFNGSDPQKPAPRLLLDWTVMDAAGKAAAKARIDTLLFDTNYNTPVWDAFHDAVKKAETEHLPAHKPVVIGMTDGANNVNNYGIVPPAGPWPPYDNDGNPADDWVSPPGVCGLCEAPLTVFTIGLGYGNGTLGDPLEEIALSSNPPGEYYCAPSSGDLIDIYKNISGKLTNNTAAIKPSPTESMITDVLPPYIEYQGGWLPTANNSASIVGFNMVKGAGMMWELRWEVPKMVIGNCFEVQYQVKSNLPGWQSVGVNSYNATTVYRSDYCRVRYGNWQYERTKSPSDIWTNETNDVSIFVKNWTDGIVVPPDVPPTPPPPPGQPVLAPILNPISVAFENLIIQPVFQMQGVVQPQLMLNTMLQPMMNPVNMPNFVGMVTAIGMMEKIKVKRKMRAMRMALKDEHGESLELGIGE
jgi:hypothetical protein